MSFPFVTTTGVYLAKDSFQLGIRTNLPVWLCCDISLDKLTGKLKCIDSTNSTVFLSLASFHKYLERNIGFYKALKVGFGFAAVGFFVLAVCSFIGAIEKGDSSNSDTDKA
jgi:hypothetical protein